MEKSIGNVAGDSKRGKNFKDMEVDILLRLVGENKNVLENKQTDQVTQKDKEKTWIDIEKRFNQVSGIYFRDWKTLKNKYDNLKKTSKRKWADEKKYVLGTGGGPSKSSSITHTDVKIKDIMGDLPVMGEMSRFDSDAGEVVKNEDRSFGHFSLLSNIELSSVPVIMEEGIDELQFDHIYALSEERNKSPTETSSGHFMVCESPKKNGPVPTLGLEDKVITKPPVPLFDTQFSVKKLKSKSSSPLQFRKKRASPLDNTLAGKKIEVMSKTKQELFEIQKTLVLNQIKHEEEHRNIKMKLMEEEHSKKMMLLDLKIKNEQLKMNQNEYGLKVL